MTSQPDKLFREKLENFHRPAPAAAWDRIESGLARNQSKGIWLKFAAGLTVFAMATYLLWPSDQPENQQATNLPAITPKTERVEKNNPEKVIPTTSTKEPINQKSIAKTKAAKNIQPAVKAEPVLENKDNITEQPIQPTETSVQVAAVEVTETAPSKTIVYTAEEVNAKFLRKKSTSEATASEKKTSGMQKLMGLAYTIKNPENGLGDLRQKKDEILALNFLSNEDKTNKEKN